MDFDIYRRSTRTDRMNCIARSNSKKVISNNSNDIYSKLSENNKKCTKSKIESENNAKKGPSRRMDKYQSDQLYNRLVEWNNIKQQRLKIMQEQKQKRLEEEENKAMLKSIPKINSQEVIKRMSEDIIRRNINLKNAINKKIHQENMEVN